MDVTAPEDALHWLPQVAAVVQFTILPIHQSPPQTIGPVHEPRSGMLDSDGPEEGTARRSRRSGCARPGTSVLEGRASFYGVGAIADASHAGRRIDTIAELLADSSAIFTTSPVRGAWTYLPPPMYMPTW